MTADDEQARGDQQELTFGQAFARMEVTERAIVRIWLGLRMIEVLTDEADAGVVADNSDVPLEILAAGFEQLMKAILVLGYLEHDQRWLGATELKSYRHNVVDLLDAVTALARRTGYAEARPATRDDVEFLDRDPTVRLLADAMVGVTDAGRYDALNEFVGDKRRRPAGVVVSTIEEMLLRLHPDIKTQPAASIDQALTAAYRREVITTGQRWARALARTYTLGLCGSRGQQLKGMVGIFLNLRDHELQSVASWR